MSSIHRGTMRLMRLRLGLRHCSAQAGQTGRYVAAIDQGTSSTRFMIFNKQGEVVSMKVSEYIFAVCSVWCTVLYCCHTLMGCMITNMFFMASAAFPSLLHASKRRTRSTSPRPGRWSTAPRRSGAIRWRWFSRPWRRRAHRRATSPRWASPTSARPLSRGTSACSVCVCGRASGATVMAFHSSGQCSPVMLCCVVVC